jgi:hypothetical protein
MIYPFGLSSGLGATTSHDPVTEPNNYRKFFDDKTKTEEEKEAFFNEKAVQYKIREEYTATKSLVIDGPFLVENECSRHLLYNIASIEETSMVDRVTFEKWTKYLRERGPFLFLFFSEHFKPATLKVTMNSGKEVTFNTYSNNNTKEVAAQLYEALRNIDVVNK